MSKSNVLPAATGYQGPATTVGAARAIPQSVEDVVIPDIEIDDGWSVHDVKTFEDCEDANAYLVSAVAAIEYAIDIEDAKPQHQQDLEWRAKARCALRYKKAALSIVSSKRSKLRADAERDFLNRRDAILLEYIRTRVTDEQFLNWVAGSGCDRIARGAA